MNFQVAKFKKRECAFYQHQVRMKLQLVPSPIADEAPALPSPPPLPPPVSNSSCLSVQCQPDCQLLYGTAEVFKVLCCRTNNVSLFFALVFHILFLCRAVLSHFSCIRLFATPWTTARQAPLSKRFPREEYWSGLPCPPPGDLRNPGIEHSSPVSPALQADSLLLSHRGSILFVGKVL